MIYQGSYYAYINTYFIFTRCNSTPQKYSLWKYTCQCFFFSNFIKLCNYYHYLILDILINPQKKPVLITSHTPSSSPWLTGILLPASISLPVLDLSYRCKVQQEVFSGWPLSFSILFSKFILLWCVSVLHFIVKWYFISFWNIQNCV